MTKFINRGRARAYWGPSIRKTIVLERCKGVRSVRSLRVMSGVARTTHAPIVTIYHTYAYSYTQTQISTEPSISVITVTLAPVLFATSYTPAYAVASLLSGTCCRSTAPPCKQSISWVFPPRATRCLCMSIWPGLLTTSSGDP
jgi:hypothetical protein